MVLELPRGTWGRWPGWWTATKRRKNYAHFVKSFAHTARLPLLNGTERLSAAAGLITALKHDSHALTIIGGGRAALWEAGGLRAGGNSQLAARHREEAAKRPRLLWIDRGW
jgi:hypothetical protein